ncbi:MAG: CHAD domain-containing protein [Bryobacteraceae bacterium]|nr:CHAD domain-containing protein [Bryobacteraceae bacterium]
MARSSPILESARMEEYARQQTRDLLRRMAFQAGRTCRLQNEAAVHDLRVSIRRLQQCLRVFRQFLPSAPRKKLRQELKRVLDMASEVRNRDVALDILHQTEALDTQALQRILQDERRHSARTLEQELQKWSKKNQQRKWREKLDL